jgi:hypothetical protein
VLVYHAIAIWVPGLGGLVAWLPTRAGRASDAAHAAADPQVIPAA